MFKNNQRLKGQYKTCYFTQTSKKEQSNISFCHCNALDFDVTHLDLEKKPNHLNLLLSRGGRFDFNAQSLLVGLSGQSNVWLSPTASQVRSSPSQINSEILAGWMALATNFLNSRAPQVQLILSFKITFQTAEKQENQIGHGLLLAQDGQLRIAHLLKKLGLGKISKVMVQLNRSKSKRYNHQSKEGSQNKCFW